MSEIANEPLTVGHFLQTLVIEHSGQEHGIRAIDLAAKLGISEREVRRLCTQLRIEGHPICAHPATGYFLAKDHAELWSTIEFLRDRGLHHLQIAAQLAKVPLPDFIGQQKLPT
ncbi:MAG: hypothetical protein IT518_14605 [Burkholderiales bacterium]|nr:hypothetical protein [Burkholderiales bacterium]